jgi:hypothetical protein
MSAFATQDRKFSVKKLRCEKIILICRHYL